MHYKIGAYHILARAPSPDIKLVRVQAIRSYKIINTVWAKPRYKSSTPLTICP